MTDFGRKNVISKILAFQDEAIRMVNVKGRQVPVKTIELSDDQTEAQVTLWRSLTETHISTGSHFKLTNLQMSVYKNKVSFNTTYQTSVQVNCYSHISMFARLQICHFFRL